MLAHLEDFRKLSSSDIRVHIQDLPLRILRQTGQDRQTSRPDSRLDRRLVDLGDLPNKPILGLVEVLGRKDAGWDGAGARTEAFERGGELEVLLQEDPAGNVERLGVGDSDTVLVVGNDTFSLEELVTDISRVMAWSLQLRSTTVQDDGVETEPVEE